MTDNRAASDYYSGNVISRKTYSFQSGTGKNAVQNTVTIDTDSRHAGYENSGEQQKHKLQNRFILLVMAKQAM